MADKKIEKTKAGSHVATERGYANGRIIEPGMNVPVDTPVSEEWMEPAKKSKDKSED